MFSFYPELNSYEVRLYLEAPKYKRYYIEKDEEMRYEKETIKKHLLLWNR